MNISALINEFVGANLEPRQQEVIRGRYGLDGKEGLTLQAIGNRYGITRERVRQIETIALANLREKFAREPQLKSFIQASGAHLKSLGGVAREDQFFGTLQKLVNHRGGADEFTQPVRFVLEFSGKVFNFRDNYSHDWHDYWYLTETDRKRAQEFVKKLGINLNSKKEEVLAKKNFNDIFANFVKSARLTESVARNYLTISKKFTLSPFGEFGLATWSEINPRTARDWAYAILKKENKPLHFSKISEIIRQHRKDKRTNLQTIHNELIKDDRFVLVGRGLYGLGEFGLIPGTAREIIAFILKKHGPLRTSDVINEVKEQRVLKEATILINLQNRKNFRCLPDGRWCPREA